MINKTFDIILDIEKDLYTPSNLLFTVSRDDLNDITLNFVIENNGQPFDLTGTTIELAVRKPSGLTTYTGANIQNAGGGLASMLLGLQSYSEYGIYTAEIHIRTVDQMAVTCPFYYQVREAILTSYDVPTINDWSALQQALFGYDNKPILVDGVPTEVPEYVGQSAVDITGKRFFVAMAAAADGWQLVGVGEGGTGVVSWADILNKPTTFAPAAHTHTIADVTDLQTELDAKANIADIPPAQDLTGYLTTAEGDTRYEPIGSTPDMTGYLTETDAAATYQPIGDYLTTAEGDAKYEPLGSTPDMTGYLTTTDGDARYQQLGTDTPDDWTEITNKPTTFPPAAHQHTSADITDFAAAVAADIPADYLTQTEGDARYSLKGTSGTASAVDWGNITGDIGAQTDLQNALATKANVADIPDTTGMITQTDADARYQQLGTDVPDDWVDITNKPTTFPPAAHTHAIADVTGLQGELDAKANTTDIPDTTGMITQTDADARYQQIGTDTPDDWADITGKPATFPPSTHQHTTADITDFGTGVAAAIPAEYLTETEGDAKYEPIGSTPDMTGYLTTTDGDARYQQIGTDTPDDWTEITNKPASFPPSAHNHTTADITDFATGVAGAIPAEYLTTTEGDAAYQKLGVADDWANITGKPATFPPSAHTHAIADVTNLQSTLDTKAPLASPALTGTPTAPTAAAANNTTQIATTAFVQQQGFLKTIPLASGAAVGGVQVGNGLGMSGNYLYVKQGASIGIDANYSLQVQTSNTTPAPLKFWLGIQTDYDAIATKDPNTLYFITG